MSEILATSDIIVILLPSTPETSGLLNAHRLAQIKRGTKLINFARASIIDHGALVAALQSGVIAHAVLDVFDQEPLPIESHLWSNPNVTVLPHISAPTDKMSAADSVIAAILAYQQNGNVPEFVDKTQGY